jgi:TRAP-type mannitol/chloroaromatic compound transport system permease small subunit
MRLEKFLKTIDKISEWSGRIFIWLIIPLTALVVFEVISRRIFDSPHIWAPEITDFIYGPYFMLVAAYTLRYKGHVAIDIRLSPRTQGILDIFTYLVFFLPFCIIVFYQGIIYAQTSWLIHETSGSAALPVIPEIKTVIPVTFALLLLQGVANLIRSIIQTVKGEAI